MTAFIQPEDELALPGAYPADLIETVTIGDGTPVTIRPIRAEDAPLLQEGFTHLSPQSIYLRFFETFQQLPDVQAHRLATVDYRSSMAFVAEIQENSRIRLIGVARYANLSTEVGLAECAIVVADDFQNRGLGSLLLNRLIGYARKHGITAFLATVQMTNNLILRFVQRSGFVYDKKMVESGIWEIKIVLEAKDEPRN